MQHVIPLSAVEIENRLKKIPDLDIFCSTTTAETIDGVEYITIDAPQSNITDGLEIKFKSPIASSDTSTTRLRVNLAGTNNYKVFAFADANGNDIGEVNNLFAKNAIVKVILDLTYGQDMPEGVDGAAFVQNANTNSYIEAQLAQLANTSQVQIITWEDDD